MKLKKFIYPMIIVFIIAGLSVEIYNFLNPKKAKSSRLACHSEVVVFERIYYNDLIKDIQEAIKAGNIELNARVQKSEYMDSQLFTHISQQQIEQKIMQRFEKEKTDVNSDKKAVIDLLIYENDKEDPKKKTPAAKKYAGYLSFEYKYENMIVYKFQIDFMDMKALDIDRRIDCAVESVVTIKKGE